MRLAKGTRAKVVRPFTSQDRLGDVFEVAECDSESITLNRCYSDSKSYLHEYTYTMPTKEFSVFFEVIGMEEFKKKAEDKVIIGAFTEEQLDNLWNEADSYENFKEKLKLAAKKKDKPPKGKRQWTPWTTHPLTGFAYSVSHPTGKSAKVKVKSCGFVGIASCNPEDVWDLDLGIELAAARAEEKRARFLATKAADDYLEKMDDLHFIMNRIYGRVGK